MTDATEPSTSYEPLGSLILGYLIILIGEVYSVSIFAGQFATGKISPIDAGAAMTINSIGLVTVGYAHILHLRLKGGLTILDRQIGGIPIKHIMASATAGVLLPGIFVVMIDSGYSLNVEYYTLFPDTVYSATADILALVMTGIMMFNLVFVFVGPVYILGFYLIAVRENSEG